MSDKWQCSNCKGINPGNRASCMGCDTPRPDPVGSLVPAVSQTWVDGPSKPTPNLDKAGEIWEELNLDNMEEHAEREKALRATSYLRLAVENKEGPPGDAAERLAFHLRREA